MKETWFVAKRLFGSSNGRTGVSRPAIRIATLGVAVGVAVMIVSVCVVTGFQKEIVSKMFGLAGHVQVFNYESLGRDYQPIVLDDGITDSLLAIPHVEHVQRFSMKPGMLKTEHSFRGVVFRGVGSDYDATYLRNNLVDGVVPEFSDSSSTGKLLISQTLSSQLRLGVGNSVYAYFFEDGVKARKFTVSGIYCTNMTDFDNQLVYCDVYTVNRLLGWDSCQYAGAEIVIDSYSNIDRVMPLVIGEVKERQDPYGNRYTCMTVRDLYPQVFAWLELLDMDVWAILVLMVCVSGITMVSGLLIIILERTNFIGIMKALGASNTAIRHIFIYFAVLIILRGLVIGNVVAGALMAMQKAFGLVRLDPETYYIDTVPLDIDVSYIMMIDVATLLVCVLALLVPSYIISNIHPARSIRFE